MLPFFWYLYHDFATSTRKYLERSKQTKRKKNTRKAIGRQAKKLNTAGNNALVSLHFVNEPVNESLVLEESRKETNASAHTYQFNGFNCCSQHYKRYGL